MPRTAVCILAMVSVQVDSSAFATWMTDVTPEEAATAHGAALGDAGHTVERNSNLNGMFVTEYTGNGHTVSFNSIEADGQTTPMVTASKC